MAKPQPRRFPREDRRAEAVTVLWVLSVVATVSSEVLGIGVQLALGFISEFERLPAAIWALPGLMLVIALVTGLVSVVLLPLVYRFRRVSPPPSFVAFSLTAAAVPILVGIVLTLRAG